MALAVQSTEHHAVSASQISYLARHEGDKTIVYYLISAIKNSSIRHINSFILVSSWCVIY